MYKIYFDFKTNSLKLTVNGILAINETMNTLVCEIEAKKAPAMDTTGFKYSDFNIVPMIHEIQPFGREHLEELAGTQEIWKNKILIRQ